MNSTECGNAVSTTFGKLSATLAPHPHVQGVSRPGFRAKKSPLGAGLGDAMSQEARDVLLAQWDLGVRAAKALETFAVRPVDAAPVASAEVAAAEELQFRRDEVGALRVLLLQAWERNRALQASLPEPAQKSPHQSPSADMGPLFIPADFSRPLGWFVHPATLHPKALGSEPAPDAETRT
jgi:hypothetical protein